MPKTRPIPPYPDGRLLTDGGLETTLSFLEGHDLTQSFACCLLKTDEGRRALEDYYVGYAQLAASYELGIVLDSPTRQASAAWGQTIGADAAAVDWFNERSVALLLDVRARHSRSASPIVISGAVGRHPAELGTVATASWAAAYHGPQIRQLVVAGVDVITAKCMTGSAEAIGIADASAANGVPCTVSFTIDSDGLLPGGETLSTAIQAVDDATGGSVHGYMVDCAPVDSVDELLARAEGEWVDRIHGLRLHASPAMGRDLTQTTAGQSGDPASYGRAVSHLQNARPHLKIVGGCCGTDERHLEAVARNLSR